MAAKITAHNPTNAEEAKTMKTLVDVNWVVMSKKRIAMIDMTDIEDIIWVVDGEVVELTKEEMEDWTFPGINSTDILSTNPKFKGVGRTGL